MQIFFYHCTSPRWQKCAGTVWVKSNLSLQSVAIVWLSVWSYFGGNCSELYAIQLHLLVTIKGAKSTGPSIKMTFCYKSGRDVKITTDKKKWEKVQDYKIYQISNVSVSCNKCETTWCYLLRVYVWSVHGITCMWWKSKYAKVQLFSGLRLWWYI